MLENLFGNPRNTLTTTSAKTLALLDTLLDVGISQMILSSICATYGVPHKLPISEGDSQDPINHYGVSKLFEEKILNWYEVAYRLGHMNMRYFNAAGADPDEEIGEDNDPETHLIPRDYVHVCDLARAHVNALDYLLAGGHSVSVNLGTGRGHFMRDVISDVEAVSGRSVPVVESPRRAGDPPTHIANPKLGQTLLRWTPDKSDLQTIVQTAWQWHQKTSAKPIRRRACVARPSQVLA